MHARKGSMGCLLSLMFFLAAACGKPDPELYLNRVDFLNQRGKPDEIEKVLAEALDEVDDPEYRRKYYLYRIDFNFKRYLETTRESYLHVMAGDLKAMRSEKLIDNGLPYTYAAQAYEKQGAPEKAMKYWSYAERMEKNRDQEKAGDYAFRILKIREEGIDAGSGAGWRKKIELYGEYLKKYPAHVRARQVRQMETNAYVRLKK